MVTEEDIAGIFNRITEEYEEPIAIGGRCESRVFYRVEDLRDDDIDACALYVARRIENVVSPQIPHLFIKLPGGFTAFSERLSAIYSDRVTHSPLTVEPYIESKFSNGYAEQFRTKNAVLITDVITTARSSLEAHTRAALKGIQVLCWATLVDRTFGPGPVPVVSSFTGAPVRLLTNIG
jgi:hypothetical protein